MKKTKTIKAWAVVDADNGSIIKSPFESQFITHLFVYQHVNDKSKDVPNRTIAVPVTITYQLPQQTKRK